MRNGITSAIFVAVLLPLAMHAQAPTTILSTDLLTNSRTTINTNFSSLYTTKASLVNCSGTVGSFVNTLNGNIASTCGTLTWANILALSGTPATFVTSWNSRSGAVTLGQADVAAVEQDLRNTASPTFTNLGLGGTLSVTGGSTLTGVATFSAIPVFSLGVGTVGTGTWNGSVIGPTYGGTGVNNGSSTLTIGGNVVFSGAFNPTIVVPATGSWTLPAAGTLIGSADTGTVTNTMLAGSIAKTKITGTAVTLADTGTVTNAMLAGSISNANLATPANTNFGASILVQGAKIAAGQATLSSGTPSTVTVTLTNLTFSGTNDYACALTAEGNTAAAGIGLALSRSSGSAFVITGPNASTAVIDYVCAGF